MKGADHFFCLGFSPIGAELKSSRTPSPNCLAVHVGRERQQTEKEESEFCLLFFYKFTLDQFLATLTGLRVSTQRTYCHNRKDSKIT